MRDGVHVRLTLTRGEKVTSGHEPGAQPVGPVPDRARRVEAAGLRPRRPAAWSRRRWRRNPPQCLDSKIHHNNLLNNILAKIEANHAGADDAVMLDVEGFVAETNATNLFLVARGALATPTADHCLPGITRGIVLELARPRPGSLRSSGASR